MSTIKISIVGTEQTGSTRLFNLIRLIYESKGKTVYSGWKITNKQIEALDSKYDVIISKAHDCGYDYINSYNIKLLPIRNIIDSAISAAARANNYSIDFYKGHCNMNIRLFNKFKEKCDFIFRYEDYNVHYIKQLCSVLNVTLNNNEIIGIMKILENMHKSKDIVKKDNHRNELYKKTLLSQDHNTSDGKTNKFVNLQNDVLTNLLNEQNIYTFLEEQKYF